MPQNTIAILVAGGTGTRMGSGLPKQFLDLEGKPVLMRALETWLSLRGVWSVVTVLHPDWVEHWQQYLYENLSQADRRHVAVAAGGSTRTQSVRNGLMAAQTRVGAPEGWLVAIHDGVRPFATPEMINKALDSAAQVGGAVCCVPVKASLRENKPDGLSQAVDRSRFLEVQTPQCFRLDLLADAYDRFGDQEFTDDASLFEAAGNLLCTVPGSYDNLKITTPEDLELARLILRRQTGIARAQ